MSYLGVGVGYRKPHGKRIKTGPVQVDWFEVITENYLGPKGIGAEPQLRFLEGLRQDFPIVMHGVSLSIGGTDPLKMDYLGAARAIFDRLQPEWVSDHLCWTGVQGVELHELLPLPYTEETIQHVVGRIQKVQDFWGRPLMLENVSSYVNFPESEMSESAFVAEVLRRSGASLLLDVNNVFVSSFNHGFDPIEYIRSIPKQAVGQIHLAGHIDSGDLKFDTHSQPVRDEVWALYRETLRYLNRPISTMVEWDSDLPSYEDLEAQALQAKHILEAEHGKTQVTTKAVFADLAAL